MRETEHSKEIGSKIEPSQTQYFTEEERPALEASYKQFRGWLEHDLDSISAADLATARKRAQQLSQYDDGDIYFEACRAFDLLSRLKAIKNRDAAIEVAAQRELFSLADAETVITADHFGQPIANAIYHLSRCTENLGRFKFQETYQQQITDREQSRQRDIEKTRERLMRQNVS
jgi:hypothetical protein